MPVVRAVPLTAAALAVALAAAVPAAADPVGPAPGTARGAPHPWLETPLGSWWLQPGGGCWAGAGGVPVCTTAPSLSDRPLVRVHVGEKVTLHLGQDPSALTITSGVRPVNCAGGLEPNPTTAGRQVPVRRLSGVLSWTARPSDHGYLTVLASFHQGSLKYLARVAILASPAGRAPNACRPDHTPPRVVGVEVQRTAVGGVRAVLAMSERATASGTLQRLAGGRAVLVRRFTARRGPVSSQQVLRFGALAPGVYRLRLTLRDRAGNTAAPARRIVVPPAG